MPYDTPAFPEGTKFAALFIVVAKKDVVEYLRQSPAWTNYQVHGSPIRHRKGEDTGRVGGYFHFTDQDGKFKSFYVRPSKMLLDWIDQNMLIVNRDTIHFDGWVRDGKVFVNAEYGQIIGHRFLGAFEPEEISAALNELYSINL